MGKDMVKQNITFYQTESFACPSRVCLTRETVMKNLAWYDTSSSSHMLYTWPPFEGKLLARQSRASREINLFIF